MLEINEDERNSDRQINIESGNNNEQSQYTSSILQQNSIDLGNQYYIIQQNQAHLKMAIKIYG